MMKMNLLTDAYKNEESFEAGLNAIFNLTGEYIKGSNITFYDAKGVIEQFTVIQKYYGISDGWVWHFTLSGKSSVKQSVKQFKQIADNVTKILGRRFQVVYAIHKKKNMKTVYANFVLNSISFHDGEKYDGNFRRDCGGLDAIIDSADVL